MQATERCALIAMHDLQTMQSSRKTKMDEFEYVTYGKIFKYADAGVDTNTNAVRMSFRMQTLYKLHALNCFSLLRGMLLLLHQCLLISASQPHWFFLAAAAVI